METLRLAPRIVFALIVAIGSSVAPVEAIECAGPGDVGKAAILATQLNPPGFPEGIAVRGNRFYVSGPATLGTIGKGPSLVLEFDRATGALVRSFPVPGEDLLMEHANSCLALGAEEDQVLYVLNTQKGMLRLDLVTGQFSVYAPPVPDLQPCLPLVSPPPCSPTILPAPPITNDIAFDPLGDAYVTDSTQATIWRIPAGGGTPQIWFQDMRLASPYIGVNGIRVHPDGDRLFITVTLDLLGSAFVYTLPLGGTPTAASLQVFHQFAPGDIPDGIAFGENGDLYVVLALPVLSGILVLDPNGVERGRFMNALTSPIAPYDSPANLAFDPTTRTALVTNHAFVTGIVLPSQFSVAEVCLDDAGAPLFEPNF